MSIISNQYGRFEYFEYDCIGNNIASGRFWDECLRPYMDALEKGEVYVDVGANIGFFPVYLGGRGVICHAFEASKELYELLTSNMVSNPHPPDCVAYNIALYDKEETLVLHKDWKQWTAVKDGRMDYEKTANSGWLCLVPETIGDNCDKFEARTLDSFNIENVRLLKIDTQGCDLRILHGAKQTILKSKPVVLFEYEDFVSVVHGDTFDKYEKFFLDINYTIKRIGDVEWVGEPHV